MLCVKIYVSEMKTHTLTIFCQWAGGLLGGPAFCRDCHTLLYSSLLWMEMWRSNKIA